MWISIKNPDQVIWLAGNQKWAWRLNLFSMRRVKGTRYIRYTEGRQLWQYCFSIWHTFLFRVDPFPETYVQECKQEVTKVVSLVKNVCESTKYILSISLLFREFLFYPCPSPSSSLFLHHGLISSSCVTYVQKLCIITKFRESKKNVKSGVFLQHAHDGMTISWDWLHIDHERLSESNHEQCIFFWGLFSGDTVTCITKYMVNDVVKSQIIILRFQKKSRPNIPKTAVKV